MTKTIARIALAAALATAALTTAGVASAHTTPVTRTARIMVSDLDFSRAAHVAKFEKRISRAAYDLCPIEARQNSAKAEACRSGLQSQAIAKLSDMQRVQLAQAAASAFNLAAN